MEKLIKFKKAFNEMKFLGEEQCDWCIENFLDILIYEFKYKGSIHKAVEWWDGNKNKINRLI